MSINFTSPAGFTTAVLIADTYQAPNGSNDSISTLTQSGGIPAAAALEIQSTQGALLIPRMTTTQKNDLATAGFSAIVDGMIVYDVTLGVFSFREGGAWNTLAAGSVSGPGVSSVGAIARWANTIGTVLENSGVVIDNSNNATGFNSISVSNGSLTTPTIHFTASPSTGFSSTGGTPGINFLTQGGLQFQVLPTASAVNWISVTGSATGFAPDLVAHGTDTNVGINLAPQAAGTVSISNGTNAGAIELYNAAATFYVGFQAPACTQNTTWTLPLVDAVTPGEVLSSNASGVLSWVSNSATVLQVAVVTVTSAEILSLHSAPITVVAGQGANTMVNVFDLVVEFVPVSTPYTVAGGSTLQFQYSTNGDNVAVPVAGTGLLDQTTKHLSTTDIDTVAGLTSSSVSNASIDLTTSADANFTLGNGTLTITIYYTVLTI
jgi:hypothetical protein